jgi:hypothetical protein
MQPNCFLNGTSWWSSMLPLPPSHHIQSSNELTDIMMIINRHQQVLNVYLIFYQTVFINVYLSSVVLLMMFFKYVLPVTPSAHPVLILLGMLVVVISIGRSPISSTWWWYKVSNKSTNTSTITCTIINGSL